MAALSKDEIKARLKGMDGWKLDRDELEKKYEFADFAGSMSFVNRVATLAEAVDHHPDISIKYNRVKLTVSTHSAGGVTEKDFALIDQIDGGPPAPTGDPEEGEPTGGE